MLLLDEASLPPSLPLHLGCLTWLGHTSSSGPIVPPGWCASVMPGGGAPLCTAGTGRAREARGGRGRSTDLKARGATPEVFVAGPFCCLQPACMQLSNRVTTFEPAY
jgi:hypothetical protein